MTIDNADWLSYTSKGPQSRHVLVAQSSWTNSSKACIDSLHGQVPPPLLTMRTKQEYQTAFKVRKHFRMDTQTTD